jgi:hypothetical protein
MNLQVQVVAGGNIVVATLTATEALVDAVQRLMNVNESVDDSGSVSGWHSKFAVCDREGPGRIVRGEIQVKGECELHSDLIEGLVGPISKPVQYATIEQGWGSRGTRGEAVLGRIHGENDMQVLRDLLSEPTVKFLVRVEHKAISLGTFFTGSHESGVLVTLEKTWNFSVGKKSVHSFQETRIENVRFVHDEADLFTLGAGATKDGPKIFIKVFSGILVGHLDLEDAEAIHPGDETR